MHLEPSLADLDPFSPLPLLFPTSKASFLLLLRHIEQGTQYFICCTLERNPPKSRLPHICLAVYRGHPGSSGWWSRWGSRLWRPCATLHTRQCVRAGCSWHLPCSLLCPLQSEIEIQFNKIFVWSNIIAFPIPAILVCFSHQWIQILSRVHD